MKNLPLFFRSVCTAVLLLFSLCLLAQKPYSISDIRRVYLRSSGEILNNNEVKGYYMLYNSDKVDKRTNEYTLKVLDEYLKEVTSIVFEDENNIRIIESASDGKSMVFVVYDMKQKQLEYRGYDFTGKKIISHIKPLERRDVAFINTKVGDASEMAENDLLFDVGDKGYLAIFPIHENKFYTYEISGIAPNGKIRWTYAGAEDQEKKFVTATFLGSNDSTLLFELGKRRSIMGAKQDHSLLAINAFTGKKMFETNLEDSNSKIMGMNVMPNTKPGEINLMGPYFSLEDDVIKSASKGVAMWTFNSKGKLVSKVENSWQNDFSKFLPLNKKGKVDNIGYIYFHNIFKMPDGQFFAVGEGYKKEVSTGAVALNLATLALTGRQALSNVKLTVTDLVLAQFDADMRLKEVSIYDKNSNSVMLPTGFAYSGPHLIAKYALFEGRFDYDFTKLNLQNNQFVVGYSDYERTGENKGRSFNTVTYDNGKLSTDKMSLRGNGSFMRVLPSKAGQIAILEYIRKEKRLEMRIEKMN